MDECKHKVLVNIFFNSFLFHALGKVENALLTNNHLVKIHKISYVNFRIGKNGGASVL
jgi:hypothetical protein